MVLKYLLYKLINNPQIIDKLADSYPIRRAAQLTAYAIQRGKAAAQEATEAEINKRLNKFQDTFKQELKEGFKTEAEKKKPPK